MRYANKPLPPFFSLFSILYPIPSSPLPVLVIEYVRSVFLPNSEITHAIHDQKLGHFTVALLIT